MSVKLLRPFIAFIVLFIFTACSLTRWVPSHKQLLLKNEFVLNGRKKVPSAIKSIVKQSPNKRLLRGPRTALYLYNWGNPEAEKGLKKFWIEAGEAPVIIDTALVERSAYQMGVYLFNQGYFENATTYQIVSSGNKKAKVVYELFSGPRYNVSTYKYSVESPSVEYWLKQSEGTSLVKIGQPYDAAVLESERERIVDLLREKGFYAFPKERIKFEADTNVAAKLVSLHMKIEDRVIEIRDSSYRVPFLPSVIERVEIDPDFAIVRERKPFVDSLLFNSKYWFFYRDSSDLLKPQVVSEALYFKPGEVYQQSKIRDSYRHLIGLRIFQSTDISFANLPADSNSERLVARIKLNPYNSSAFTTELTGTNTAGNFGIGGSFGWTNRNPFKGGEILNLRIRGSVEAQYNSRYSDQIFNTREIGLETSIDFPRFLLPFRTYGLLPKRMRPRSGVAFDIIYQQRAEFERYLLSTRLYYDWWESNTKQHTFNLIDLRYTNVIRIDPEFFEDLPFKTGFESLVALSTRYTFNYNEQPIKGNRNFRILRGNIETAGNVSSLLLKRTVESGQADRIFGVQSTQYLRLDADFRFYWHQKKDEYLIFRFFSGILWAYGNGDYVLPFEKAFFAGGTNDIRAWPAYRLGPGGYSEGNTRINIAPLKILGNLEYRNTIWGALKGAAFIDVGNIWVIQSNKPVHEAYLQFPETLFKWNEFLNQIAIGGGLGVRYDLSFFVIRLDVGVPFRYPYQKGSNNRNWFPEPLKINDYTFNLGIGYPF